MKNNTKNNKIQTFSCQTPKGNCIGFFYNPEINLICIDVTSKDEQGGNEIFRKYLDEDSLLSHCE